MKKLVVFPNDPLLAYYKKGELKTRYFNPKNFFNEVHIISFTDNEVESEKAQIMAGRAKLKIYPVGKVLSIKNPFHFFKKYKQILEIIKNINPCAIRAYNPEINGFIATKCAKTLNIPIIISLHGDFNEMRNLPLHYGFVKLKELKNHLSFIIISKLTEKYCLQNANMVICVSKFLTKYAKKYGAKKIEVIYNRVYFEQFKKPFLNSNNKKFNILTVGRLEPQKNQQTLIRAMQNIDGELTILGNGRDKEVLKKLSIALGIENKIKFISSINNNKIQKFYWKADIFAIASLWEGFCIPVLEAMASSLPIVVNNKEPLPEVLGNTGIIVENNPKAFSKAFLKLQKNPKLRKKLGEKAKKRAIKLNGEIMEKRELNVYKKLI